MTDPTLQVDMEAGIAEVGGSLRGVMTRHGELDDLAGDSAQRVRAVRVSLSYYTEGRGDRDARTVAEHEYPVDEYGRMNASFQLAVPSTGPVSYDGRLVRVIWEVEARVDVKLRRDLKTQIPVLIVPRNGWGLYHRPHPLRR